MAASLYESASYLLTAQSWIKIKKRLHAVIISTNDNFQALAIGHLSFVLVTTTSGFAYASVALMIPASLPACSPFCYDYAVSYWSG